MANCWLLAAEADQIQDLVFRVSQLREVVGGSQLVERLCEDAPRVLLAAHPGFTKNPQQDLIIHRGGAFRVLFDDKTTAQDFGRDLAELYRRVTGGSLTVADPVAFANESNEAFRQAADKAQGRLIAAKRAHGIAVTPTQAPYTALCASCGISLAVTHEARREHVEDERPNYLCNDCRNKFREPFDEHGKTLFLDRFREAVRAETGADKGGHHPLYAPPGGDWAGLIGRLDPKRYVAYLIADGNGMGKVFSSCGSPQAMNKLSDELDHSLRAALAAQCAALIRHRPEIRELTAPVPRAKPAGKRGEWMPMLPLILGGDDLFALLPAPWSLDLALRFCRRYEKEMAKVLTKLEMDRESRPTVSAALVVCKANYPHTLARRRCERELARAKQVAHRLTPPDSASVLGFAVVSGNQVGGGVEADAEECYQPSLAPYVLGTAGKSETEPTVEALLDQRKKLEALPRKRRAELDQLFGSPPKGDKPPDINDDIEQHWRPKLEWLRMRIERSRTQGEALAQALAELGDASMSAHGFWRKTSRPWARKRAAYGHGLPDLLTFWDYASKLEE